MNGQNITHPTHVLDSLELWKQIQAEFGDDVVVVYKPQDLSYYITTSSNAPRRTMMILQDLVTDDKGNLKPLPGTDTVSKPAAKKAARAKKPTILERQLKPASRRNKPRPPLSRTTSLARSTSTRSSGEYGSLLGSLIQPSDSATPAKSKKPATRNGVLSRREWARQNGFNVTPGGYVSKEGQAKYVEYVKSVKANALKSESS